MSGLPGPILLRGSLSAGVLKLRVRSHVRTRRSFPGKFEWQFNWFDESDVNWHDVFCADNTPLITQVPDLQRLAYFGHRPFTVAVVAAITMADSDHKFGAHE
jgi:hypothetical protein